MPANTLCAQPSGQVCPVSLPTAPCLRLSEPEAMMSMSCCKGDQNMKTAMRLAPGQRTCGSREEGTC